MLFPTRPNVLPGLILATLPPVVVGGFGLAFLSFVGGRAEAWRLADAAGPYSLLMAVAVLGVTLALSALLSMGTRWHSPLVMLVGLATLPWLLGIAGTQEAMEKVLAALPDAGSGDALAVLVAGTGEAMVTRLVGAWMSAALLVAVAVGLAMRLERATLLGEGTGRLLGAGLSLTLGGTALLVALEAHHLFERLTTLATQAPEARAEHVAAGTEKLMRLQELRSAMLGALVVLALALICWQLLLRPEAVTRWVGSLLLTALAAMVLVLDARPMQLAAEGAREADVSHTLLPMLAPNGPKLARGDVPPGPYDVPTPGIRSER
ncbi:hypothetical protein [Vitiosangium sp. GDMCC 1.1324]|uniref:hypothetical protein n=1 Tax=Vitiosangium sp. (strain GDMCC 1.1324) TaxID=2138576 RepID=UPI000D3510E6|nr:hypothetical protein [Vitiosangium sp. GDMCC 1.1324]PTL80047.1 hypothetical protein DAT35_32055 [Vitiosangium sp. GDMCC 1.1324]